MRSQPAQITDVQVVVRGDLPVSVIDYADDKITKLVEHLGDPVPRVRIKLTRQPDPAIARPVRAQANLDLAGRTVRAQVAAATAHEAVDLLMDRVRRRSAKLKRHWQARRGARPLAAPHEWRHGSEPAHRPPYFPRPVDDRQVITHKSFSPERMSPDEAAWEMYRLDHDFYLFTEAATGVDAVIYRSGETGYRLARVAAGPRWLDLSAVPITLSPHPAPTLTVAEARQRLEATGQPFMFFADAATGQGAILYHRYDGHYGLITPSGSQSGRQRLAGG